ARAQRAIADRHFDAEIVPVQVTMGKEFRLIAHDEQPPKARPEKIPTLKPAFREGGTVTAANASSISDGAAALVLMRQSQAQQRGLQPLAVFHAHAAFADEPGLFPTAPIGAIQRLLSKAGWAVDDVDLFEINEAFAVVPLVAMSELGLAHEKVNVNGGA
ncbi:Acetyl-CoA acetyltransferase, partial [Pseudomonas coronafaciens pv. garcae]